MSTATPMEGIQQARVLALMFAGRGISALAVRCWDRVVYLSLRHWFLATTTCGPSKTLE